MAARFGVAEADLRRTLFEETGGMFPELVTRPDIEVLLPPIGGMTVYFFGEVERIADPDAIIACRVHDECNGSDVFGSDICTCRPYLVHGIEVCVETAQQGGVGIIVYNRKEGRALGEVTKFLVYNARKRQPGGDTADTYFRRTECVAGVQDMRFQELMPDVFHWLGIRRIDRWVSMSSEKRDALEAQGIEVVEQLAIPDRLVPLMRRSKWRQRRRQGISPLRGHRMRVSCSVQRAVRWTNDEAASGAVQLLSAAAVRARCAIVSEAARRGETRHFRLVCARLDEAARRVVDITRRRYPDLHVPLHSRWRHFSAGGVDRAALIAPRADRAETARARIDLAVVSVLLDAGTGPDWHFTMRRPVRFCPAPRASPEPRAMQAESSCGSLKSVACRCGRC
jgi:GTP cyclohydrolase II